MTDTNPSVALIEQLSKLAPKLADGNNVEAKNEAIQLSRQLTGSLSHPASSAVELAFAVRIEISLSQWKDANVCVAVYYCGGENRYWNGTVQAHC